LFRYLVGFFGRWIGPLEAAIYTGQHRNRQSGHTAITWVQLELSHRSNRQA